MISGLEKRRRTGSSLPSPRIILIVAGLALLVTYPASAFMLRSRILTHASFGQYKEFYVVPRGAPRRLINMVTHSFETLSYIPVRTPRRAQFILRVMERERRMRVRIPTPVYAYGAYGYGPYGPPWWGCCYYGPGWGWGWGWYGPPVIVPAYQTTVRWVRVISITAISARRNIPVWRATAVSRIHARTSQWSIVWHLVNRFPIL